MGLIFVLIVLCKQRTADDVSCCSVGSEMCVRVRFNCMRHVARQMIKQRGGRIINISSISGVMGNAGQMNYAASKAGVIGMTKTAARELAGRGITVNAIAPGFITTDMTDVLSDSVKEGLLAQIPMKAMGEPADIAGTAAFLASDDAKYITGQVINVNGGMAM